MTPCLILILLSTNAQLLDFFLLFPVEDDTYINLPCCSKTILYALVIGIGCHDAHDQVMSLDSKTCPVCRATPEQESTEILNCFNYKSG
jgi:hypothetical protein